MGPKLNERTRLDFELTYFQAAVQYFPITSKELPASFNFGEGWRPWGQIKGWFPLGANNHMIPERSLNVISRWFLGIDFGSVSCYINYCELFIIKSSSFIEIKYVWFALVCFLCLMAYQPL